MPDIPNRLPAVLWPLALAPPRWLIGPLAGFGLVACSLGHPPSYESRAIGDLRTVISAQAAYQSANNGYHDSLACLNRPVRCIPGYDSGAPTFLDPELASLDTRGGYIRSFHSGPPVAPQDIRQSHASATSIENYAYVLVPLDPPRTGRRSFCGDASGMICVTDDGSAPQVQDGRCAAGCIALR